MVNTRRYQRFQTRDKCHHHRIEKTLNREGFNGNYKKLENPILTIVYNYTEIGISADRDWSNIKSPGFRFVIAFVRQLDGTIELDMMGETRSRLS